MGEATLSATVAAVSAVPDLSRVKLEAGVILVVCFHFPATPPPPPPHPVHQCSDQRLYLSELSVHCRRTNGLS